MNLVIQFGTGNHLKLRQMYSLIVGNYGCGNYGDDLLLQSCKEHLTGDVKVMAPGSEFLPLPPCGFKSLLNIRSYKSILDIYNSKRVIFGGGGLLNADEPHSYFIWGHVLFWARLFKKEVSFLGQSFNRRLPFLLRLMIRGCNVYVRDTLSLSYYNDAKLSADLAFSLNFNHKFKRIIFDKYVCVSLRTSKKLTLQILQTYLKSLISHYKKIGYKVVFLPFDINDTRITEGLDDVVLADQNQILDFIKYCELCYTGRLHALIVSSILGTPQSPLVYANKMIGLATDLDLPYFDLRQSTIFQASKGSKVSKHKLDSMRNASLKNFI